MRLAQSSRALARAGPARSPLPCARLRTLPAPARSAQHQERTVASAPTMRLCMLLAPTLLPPALPPPALQARCTRFPHPAIGLRAGPACEARCGERRAHGLSHRECAHAACSLVLSSSSQVKLFVVVECYENSHPIYIRRAVDTQCAPCIVPYARRAPLRLTGRPARADGGVRRARVQRARTRWCRERWCRERWC